MTLAAYVEGCVALVALLTSVGWAAFRVRGALLPAWAGAPARLAEMVLGLSFVTLAMELLGSVGQLDHLPVIVGLPVLAVTIGVLVRPEPHQSAERDPSPALLAVVAGLGMLAIVTMQWLAHAKPIIEGGFQDMDSLRYHGPFVARWFQQHSLLNLQHTSGQLQETFFPANSELVSAYGVLAFGRDILSPLLNFAWFALGALAAWCAGVNRLGRAAAIAAYAAIWSMPLLAAIEPGSAKNDIAAAALVISTAALLVRALQRDGRERTRALIVVGLCGGLAVGTKLTTLVAVGVLFAGAALVSRPRVRSALVLAGPAALTGAFWYLRNLLATGNPLPWIDHLGPIALPAPKMTVAATGGWSVAHYASDAWFWTTTVPDGLRLSFGPAWPVIVGGFAVLTLPALVGRRRSPVHRVIALACLAAAALYLVTPYSAGGREGHPNLFDLDLRFLAPAFVLSVALGMTRRRAQAMLAASALIVVVDQLSERGRWPVTPLPIVVVGVAVIACAVALVVATRTLRGPALGLVGIGACIVAAVLGWSLSSDMLDDRYARVSSGMTAAFSMFRNTSGLRVAVGGFADDYPFYGQDLTNHVQFIGVPEHHGGFRPARSCTEWIDAIEDGHYDYVVVSKSPSVRQRVPVEATWTAGDPAFDLVLDRGVTRVFKRTGEPEPEACPHGGVLADLRRS